MKLDLALLELIEHQTTTPIDIVLLALHFRITSSKDSRTGAAAGL